MMIIHKNQKIFQTCQNNPQIRGWKKKTNYLQEFQNKYNKKIKKNKNSRNQNKRNN